MGFFTNFNYTEIWAVLCEGWQDFVNTDFGQLKYSETDLAMKAGAVLAFMILLKFGWMMMNRYLGRVKYSRKDSGHPISAAYRKPFWMKCLMGLPAVLMIVPLLAILFAAANPYFPLTKEEKSYIQTRSRIDAKDVSGSMGFKFKQTGKARGEFADKSYRKFLEMRRGKNDRTALWIFSDSAFPVQEDFIVDDDLMYLKAYDAPWELGTTDFDGTEDYWDSYPIPFNRYLFVPGQGGTQLAPLLKTVIHVFDKDAKKQKLSIYAPAGRSLLIITDAAISDFYYVKEYFQEISKRGIRPYIIFIDEKSGDSPQQQSAVDKLLQEVIDRGGKIFPVSDENSLDRAFQEIDKLEKVRVEIVKKNFKIPVFQKFIFLAIVSFILIIPAGLLFQLFSYP